MGGDEADLCQRVFWWRLPQREQRAWPVQRSNFLLSSGQSTGRQEGTTGQTMQQGGDILISLDWKYRKTNSEWECEIKMLVLLLAE